MYHRLSTDTENTDLFDKVVDLTYENEQLRSKIQVLQDKLEKAYEFMKQFVINGRNMLDVFRERIGEVKEWVHRKVAGIGREGMPQVVEILLWGVLLVDNWKNSR